MRYELILENERLSNELMIFSISMYLFIVYRLDLIRDQQRV